MATVNEKEKEITILDVPKEEVKEYVQYGSRLIRTHHYNKVTPPNEKDMDDASREHMKEINARVCEETEKFMDKMYHLPGHSFSGERINQMQYDVVQNADGGLSITPANYQNGKRLPPKATS